MGMDQIQPDKDHKLLYAFLGAMLIIFLLILWIIFRKPEPVVITDNSKQTRDSIKMLTGQIEEQKKITDHYLAVADSLKTLPPRIKIIYREKKQFTSTATINQLDSLIRVLSGLKAR